MSDFLRGFIPVQGASPQIQALLCTQMEASPDIGSALLCSAGPDSGATWPLRTCSSLVSEPTIPLWTCSLRNAVLGKAHVLSQAQSPCNLEMQSDLGPRVSHHNPTSGCSKCPRVTSRVPCPLTSPLLQSACPTPPFPAPSFLSSTHPPVRVYSAVLPALLPWPLHPQGQHTRGMACHLPECLCPSVSCLHSSPCPL